METTLPATGQGFPLEGEHHLLQGLAGYQVPPVGPQIQNCKAAIGNSLCDWLGG